jgi:phage baseplate assembly protein gpV
MEEANGARLQNAMQHPLAAEESEWRMNSPVRGVIRGVRFADQTAIRRTVVDCYVIDRTGRRTERGILYNVPLLYPKINADNGEEWSPEAGDYVLIGFINGNLRDPVVLGCLGPPDNTIQAKAAEAPRCHRRRNGTDEKIEKDGTRRVFVAKDDILDVVGDGTVTIGGNVSVTVEGNVTVNVVGQATVTVIGPTTVTTPTATVNAATLVELNTPLTHMTGNLAVDGGITCAGSYGSSGGKIQTPGDIESTGGDVKDRVRSMAADRDISNDHDHPGDSGGTTGKSNQSW